MREEAPETVAADGHPNDAAQTTGELRHGFDIVGHTHAATVHEHTLHNKLTVEEVAAVGREVDGDGDRKTPDNDAPDVEEDDGEEVSQKQEDAEDGITEKASA